MKLYSLLFAIFLLKSPFFFHFSKAIDCKGNVDVINIGEVGEKHFVKIQDAINLVPPGNDKWVRIIIHPGIYMEKVTIPMDRECIILEGSGAANTIITWNGHGSLTNTTATFTSYPDNFVAKRITFRNLYNKGPGVAARIYGDKSTFIACGFIGFQDTLWDVRGRHYFKSCYIQGATDFIWGSGQSIFEECLINVTAGLLPYGGAGYITAQGRASPSDPSGFVFRNCVIKGSGQTYLGRAYRAYSRVVFWGTTFEEQIVPAGWDAWKYQGHEGNFMYAEVDCQGPGADTSNRVDWARKNLNGAELQEFSQQRFINQDQWLQDQPSGPDTLC